MIVVIGWFLLFGEMFWLTIWNDKIKPRNLYHPKDVFLLMFLVVAGLYFLSLNSIGTSSWINDRFNFYMFLVILPWSTINYQKHIRRVLVTKIFPWICPEKWCYPKIRLSGGHIQVFINYSASSQVDYTDSTPFESGNDGFRTWYSCTGFGRLTVTSDKGEQVADFFLPQRSLDR